MKTENGFEANALKPFFWAPIRQDKTTSYAGDK